MCDIKVACCTSFGSKLAVLWCHRIEIYVEKFIAKLADAMECFTAHQSAANHKPHFEEVQRN
jgi:hypothetical protein